jgi:hypothetical protein
MRLSTIAIALVAPLVVAVTAAPQGLPGLDLFSGNSVGERFPPSSLLPPLHLLGTDELKNDVG